MSREPIKAALITLSLVAAAGIVAALAIALGLGGSDQPEVEVAEIAERARSSGASGSDDPLAWTPERSLELAERATLGTSHVVYAKSPDGVSASAERTAEWRKEIEAAARERDVSPDVLEAMIFLESAGRPEVMADGTPNSASGLAQIIPSTASGLLGMRVGLKRSVELTKRIGRAGSRGKRALALRLARQRAKVDERFDPEKALAGAARYLEFAEGRLGSEQLAVVSYHMGVGNLENVISAYSGDPVGDEGVADIVNDVGIDYARLFFDSGPRNHPESWAILSGFGDDSSLYFWRVRTARQIMERWRTDPEGLSETADLATEKATLEELYHPEDETEVFETPSDVADAREDGKLVALPRDPSLGFRVTGQAGALARELGVEPDLYRALRPEALATLVYLAAKVQSISGASRPLKVTSAARDRSYQELLVGRNPEATHEYSLHTTGWSFDIRRDYASDGQAEAFQFALDRLRAYAILDYAYEPAAIHVTVSPSGRDLTD